MELEAKGSMESLLLTEARADRDEPGAGWLEELDPAGRQGGQLSLNPAQDASRATPKATNYVHLTTFTLTGQVILRPSLVAQHRPCSPIGEFGLPS